ncbi:acetylornithine deacetylase [Haladaptatus litoreus]|uniref:Acetylornithine deacetylase n=1 Tax=Haladaptatus litoreus TaxID=553468 RepID=A0A1N6ULK5_9EURY|nr:M20/M25/M40 family metallo-hydrolase [Haladaptatus litoreus]SIQ66538.1 acetylornithine deacetylase [Haladaptatus litoreus]
MTGFADAQGDELRTVTERLCSFDTTGGREGPAQEWLADKLADFGFETYEWTADAERLGKHPSFPDDPTDIEHTEASAGGPSLAERPSVAGVLEFGNPNDGPTLVLNGHMDVVPVARESWDTGPFEPTWDDAGESLTARGSADMKSGVATCIFAAKHLAETDAGELDGRIVVESVVGEEEGGLGAAAAALSNPYPFERDAAIVAEPTDLTPVIATEGSVMKRLHLTGRSAHAATRWRGESVLPHFERIREAFYDLESERGESVTHPLYEEFPVPWPIVIGTVEAGTWSSTTPANLTAEMRLGVAPGETVDEVEAAYEERLAEVVEENEWLSEHPPTFERFSIQFEAAETDADEPVVGALQSAMADYDHNLDTTLRGATYGADSRHYVHAGIPTVIFGPGTIEQAHFPNETIHWPDVETAGAILVDTAREFLG